VEVTWDDRKNVANFEKHGVWFEEAVTVLANPLALSNRNSHPSGERWEYLGSSSDQRLLYVVTVEKSDDEIRIISARQATPNERRKYEEGV
jgi:uncharacterized DUF497 family protein